MLSSHCLCFYFNILQQLWKIYPLPKHLRITNCIYNHYQSLTTFYCCGKFVCSMLPAKTGEIELQEVITKCEMACKARSDSNIHSQVDFHVVYKPDFPKPCSNTENNGTLDPFHGLQTILIYNLHTDIYS